MTVYVQSSDVVMQIDLSGTGEAIPYVRKCKPVGGQPLMALSAGVR